MRWNYASKGGKRLLGTISLLVCLFLAGCWDRVEINDLAFITGAAIDQGKNGRVLFTAQIFVPKAAGGGSEGGGGGSKTLGDSMVRSANGVTLSDAIFNLQDKLSRRLFWGHNEIILFGEAAAKKGLREHLDFLMRDPSPRERAYLFVAKGEAQEVLKLKPPIERNSAEVLREMTKARTGVEMTMKDFIESTSTQKGTGILPMVTILPPTDKSAPQVTYGYSKGAAIFYDFRMIGTFDETNTQGYQWMTDKFKRTTITVNPSGYDGYISLVLLREHVKFSPSVQEENWKMNVVLSADFDVNQNTTNINLLDPGAPINEIEKDAGRKIEEIVKNMASKAQKELHADVLGYGGAFHIKYPQRWKAVEARWNEQFPIVQTEVAVHAKIRRPGLSNVKATQGKGVTD